MSLPQPHLPDQLRNLHGVLEIPGRQGEAQYPSVDLQERLRHRTAFIRWAASRPEISTGGTPTPGVVPAPANATLSAPRTTLRGRNGPVWAKVWARPNGVPALPQSNGVTSSSS